MEQQGQREVLLTDNGYRIQHPQSPYTEISVKRPGWTKPLVLAGISTCLGLSMPVGYNIGVVNTPAVIIKAFCNESVYTRYDSVLDVVQLNILWSFIVSIFLVGAAVGSLGGSVLADKIGRKGVLKVCAGLAIAAAILFFGCKAANSIEMLALGRLLAGLSAGLTTSVVPMYLTELAPLHLKGATGVLCPLGVTIGVLIGQTLSMRHILGDTDYWPHCLAFYALPVIVCSAIIVILPESPKYIFIVKKEPEVALSLLQKLRNVNEDLLREEIDELKIEEEDNQNAGASWNIGKVMADKTLLLPLLLVCFLQAGQQLSGINAVFYYSSNIFADAGLSVSASELATMGAGVCNFVMAVMSIPITSNFNRRTCALLSMASSAFFLTVLAIANLPSTKTYSWMPYISIVGVLGFVICYGLGIGPIPYFIGSELFEVGPRPSAMALGSMSNWGANFIVGLTFPTMLSVLGPAASFLIFAAFLIPLFVFVKMYLPETRGKDASEIAEICRDGFASKPLEARIRLARDINETRSNGEKLEA